MSKEENPHARLFCPTGGEPGFEFEIGAAAAIGRDSRNDVVLDFESIAPRQAQISFDAGSDLYTLENLGRRHSIRLDGLAIKGKARLGDLNVITLGDRDFVFVRVREADRRSRLEAPEPSDDARSESETLVAKPNRIAVPEFSSRAGLASQESADTRGEETVVESPRRISMPPLGEMAEGARGQPVPAEPGSDSGPARLIVTLPGGALEYDLSGGRHLLGRAEECDIRVPDSSISRRHAELKVESGQITLRDLGSVNYTFIDNQRVRAATPVRPGSKIRFGSLEARIERRGVEE